jgi:hypothetical protein
MTPARALLVPEKPTTNQSCGQIVTRTLDTQTLSPLLLQRDNLEATNAVFAKGRSERDLDILVFTPHYQDVTFRWRLLPLDHIPIATYNTSLLQELWHAS